jgi:nucleoside-diphosphate-sugar epimerase
MFKREAASEIARYFAGPALRGWMLDPRLLPVTPGVAGLRFQAVHTDDAAAAFRLAVVREGAAGAFNIAAPPVLDSGAIAAALDARPAPLPPRLVRAAATLAWRLRVAPTPPGWLDLALGVPLMDTSRAASVLGWKPSRSADEALAELLAGIRSGAGMETPPLLPRSRLRMRELATRVGGSVT